MAADAAITTGVSGTTHPRPRTVPEDPREQGGQDRERRNDSRFQVVADADAHHFERPGLTPDSHNVTAETAPSDPERRRPSEVITEIAPEIGPSETEPKRDDPSEVITEIAPEIGPSETEPKRREPSEVITEIAPEIGPSEVTPEVYPEKPDDDR